jgi:hypothetical protein
MCPAFPTRGHARQRCYHDHSDTYDEPHKSHLMAATKSRTSTTKGRATGTSTRSRRTAQRSSGAITVRTFVSGELRNEETLRKSDIEKLERSFRRERHSSKRGQATRRTRQGLVLALKQAVKDEKDVVVFVGEPEPQLANASGSVAVSTRVAPLDDVDVVVDTRTLAEELMPSGPLPTVGQVWQAQRNAEARWQLFSEFGAYTSQEIGERRSRASNKHALANRWRSEGKVFAVEHGGQLVYPGFQFDPETLAPQPVVANVLEALPRDALSDWEVALWWTAGNGWLGGRRPVDVIDDDPSVLAGAAAKLAEPSGL